MIIFQKSEMEKYIQSIGANSKKTKKATTTKPKGNKNNTEDKRQRAGKHELIEEV